MVREPHPTTITEGGDISLSVVIGKLEILPSRKGEEVYINDMDLMPTLRQYNGKRVQIVIQEEGFSSNTQSFAYSDKEMKNEQIR